MAVLNATEIMGQDIIRRCVERVIILGMCCHAVPFLRRRIGQGQKITQRCVEAWAVVFPSSTGQSNAYLVEAFPKTQARDRWVFG